jgi:3-deoxy-D-manno-octulosonic-acid transferase
VPSTSLIYRAVVSLAVPLVPVVLRDPRQRAAHLARVAAAGHLREWARSRRDLSRPLAWFHASSVGEGLQARAVIAAVRRLRPDAQLIYTHFSPSATRLADSIGADWAGFLPYDRAADMAAVVAAVRANTLVFTKLDLWPELSTRAARAGTAVALVAATVSPSSSRLRFPARALVRAGYAALDRAGAISDADAARLVRLGCRADVVTVTGDPRIDSVLDVAAAGVPLEAPASWPQRLTMIAGSTWPSDEEVLLEAFVRVRAAHPEAVLVVAPHEPTPHHVAGLAARASRLGLPAPIPIGSDGPGTASLRVVDRTGLLARLYATGLIAYVGGGWGSRGIHSVLEPAVWRRPVIIGPRDRGSRDAAILADAGGLLRLPLRDPVGALARQWSAWLAAPASAISAGAAARTALDADCGAARRSAELIAPLLSPA